MIEHARKYFDLGKQYIDSSIALMKIICRNGNETCGIANTMEEAEKIMLRKSALSDITLFVPAIFDCYHGVELYIKGLLIIKGKDFNKSHNIKELLRLLKNEYENSKIYLLIENFYLNQIVLVQEYKNENNIIDDDELYISLRYPENKLQTKKYNKRKLMYNGKLGICQIKEIMKTLKSISKYVLIEYHSEISEVGNDIKK